jgi:class 3 adenylate cyclase
MNASEIKKETDKNLRISCMSALHLASYFIKRKGIPAGRILDGLPYDIEYLKNTGNWLNNAETFRLFLNCHEAAGGFTHTDWKTVGEEIYGKGAPGYFKILFRIMPMKSIYLNIPKYISMLAKWCSYEIVSSRDGEIIYKVTHADKKTRDKYSIGGECNYQLGVLASMPKLKSEYGYVGDAKHEICSMPLHLIVENSYGLRPDQYHYDNTGFRINRQLVGRWVKLQPRNDNAECLSRDFELSGEDEANAIGIIKDVYHEGLKIFNEGDIYEAPYCVFKVTYKKRFYIGEKLNNRDMIMFLEKQLKMTEDKFRQVIMAKQEVERSLEEVTKRDEIIRAYMRDSILDEIYAGGNPLDFKPVRKNAAIMFADIRNFTAVTEFLDPMEITKLLNSYFSAMSEPIKNNHGEIDKLIGDGIMAVFPESNDAVRAAVEMQKMLNVKKQDFLPGRGIILKIGTGVNFDEVVEGNIGAMNLKMDRTIIGDGVNLASRLESLTKFYSSGIIVSDLVRGELEDSFDLRYLDLIIVKGKTRSVAIYEVLDAQDNAVREFKNATLKDYKRAVSLYSAGDFPMALKAFMSLNEELSIFQQRNPAADDPMIAIYMKRIVELIKKMDERSFMMQWDGVYRHQGK